MSTQVHSPEAARSPDGSCWCCGEEFDQDQLVHLGSHDRPVIGPVLRWLHRFLP